MRAIVQMHDIPPGFMKTETDSIQKSALIVNVGRKGEQGAGTCKMLFPDRKLLQFLRKIYAHCRSFCKIFMSPLLLFYWLEKPVKPDETNARTNGFRS